jgi:hypothetical protein
MNPPDYPEQPEPLEADPAFDSTLAAKPSKIKLPRGSILKMLGGVFHVQSGGRHHIILHGPCRKFTHAQKVAIFGHILTVRHATDKTARLQTDGKTVIDSRPIR